MCHDCWEQEGSPSIINEKTMKAASLIDKIYEFASAGGDAHIVVDDWNLEDESINFCIVEAQKNSMGFEKEQIAAELEALEALLALSEPERNSAMAIHEKFITPNC